MKFHCSFAVSPSVRSHAEVRLKVSEWREKPLIHVFALFSSCLPMYVAFLLSMHPFIHISIFLAATLALSSSVNYLYTRNMYRSARLVGTLRRVRDFVVPHKNRSNLEPVLVERTYARSAWAPRLSLGLSFNCLLGCASARSLACRVVQVDLVSTRISIDS